MLLAKLLKNAVTACSPAEAAVTRLNDIVKKKNCSLDNDDKFLYNICRTDKLIVKSVSVSHKRIMPRKARQSLNEQNNTLEEKYIVIVPLYQLS